MPFWTYLAAVMALEAVVLVHEAGHYAAARRAGIAVTEFSIGIGPKLFARWASGTRWTLRIIPLGGYCRFAEDGPGAWDLAPLSARAEVMAAGPLANFVLFGLLLPVVVLTLGAPWKLMPAFAVQLGQGALGAWVHGFAQLPRTGLPQMEGTILVAHGAAQAASRGVPDLLFYVAQLSLNLGLVNLFPLPVLDGGRLVMLGLEWVRGRRLHPAFEVWIYAGSALAMLALVAVLLAKDVATLMQGAV